MIDLMNEKWWIPFFIIGAIPALLVVFFVTYFTDVDHLHWTSVLPACSVFLGVSIIIGTTIWVVL